MDNLSLSDNPIRWAKYVSLKGQKLTQALYLVTSVIVDSEPLKWRIRDIALDILSDISMLQPPDLPAHEFTDGRQMSPLFKTSVLESAITKIDELISWLEVALAGNFVSENNLSLLHQEYYGFSQLLRERIKNTSLSKLVSLTSEETANTGHVTNRPELKTIGQTETSSIGHKQPIRQINQEGLVHKPYQKLSRLPHKNRDEAKGSRRSLIIDFLKGKDWTSIKDITEAISGCSAKTIQRELADLVRQGVLKKKGDRRWSRYLLA